MTLLHVVVGPEQHGVVRHGLLVHPEEAELLWVPSFADLAGGALAGRVVVVQVTDRLLADRPDAALAVWQRATRRAARVTVVLHDLPQASDGRWRRERSELYAALAADSDAVVVASGHERLLLRAAVRHARGEGVATAVDRRTHVIPLPVVEAGSRAELGTPAEGQSGPSTADVVTLGYVYPGKGLEQVIDATAAAVADLPEGGPTVQVRNLGRASPGHDDLVDELGARAHAAGLSWSTTGWVPDDELPGLLAAAAVPVAGHQHVSASGSIATWLSAGRRPLVVRSRYTEEMAARLPGALHLVEPGSLAGAVAQALRDPAGTWLAPEVELGPAPQEAGRRLGEVADRPAVSVVIPYYRDQPMLALILARLEAQRGVEGGLEVVVADDGSPEPPVVGERSVPVTLVRQRDDGFRLAAARNLGAAHAGGRVLVFLDGDTAPEDDYVATLQAACLAEPTLAVGRRRHADLSGSGRPVDVPWPPVELHPEPAWLRQALAASDELRGADDGSFRFLIGAVTAVSRSVVEAVGGYDATLTGYGGEDWDFAWRAWLAGARLRHEPTAVAWHDGPDLAGREEAGASDRARLAEVKNSETARLAERLPHPLVRGRGLWHEQPDVVAVLPRDSVSWAPGQVQVVLESLLRLGDVGVWVPSGLSVSADPRVHPGHPPARVLARARASLWLTRPEAVARLPWEPHPHDVGGAERELVPEGVSASGVRVCLTRVEAQARLLGGSREAAYLPAEWVQPLAPDTVVEWWLQSNP